MGEYLISKKNKSRISTVRVTDKVLLKDLFSFPIPQIDEASYKKKIQNLSTLYSRHKFLSDCEISFARNKNLVVDLHKTKNGQEQLFIFDKMVYSPKDHEIEIDDLPDYMLIYPNFGSWIAGSSIMNIFFESLLNILIAQITLGTIRPK